MNMERGLPESMYCSFDAQKHNFFLKIVIFGKKKKKKKKHFELGTLWFKERWEVGTNTKVY